MGQAEPCPQRNRLRTDEGGDRMELGPQHGRDLPGEEVACHAAADAGHTSSIAAMTGVSP